MSQLPLRRPPAPIRVADARDREVVASVLTDACFVDPVVAWLVPDARRRRWVLPAVHGHLADAYLRHGEVRLSIDGRGAALWVAPGVAAVAVDEAAAFDARLAELCGPDADRSAALAALLDAHRPQEPCWYLARLGVVVDGQDRGLGSSLLASVLAECDRECQPAYLEATSERSRSLFQRHGFVVTAEFAPAGGPPIWGMWRAPR